MTWCHIQSGVSPRGRICPLRDTCQCLEISAIIASQGDRVLLASSDNAHDSLPETKNYLAQSAKRFRSPNLKQVNIGQQENGQP